MSKDETLSAALLRDKRKTLEVRHNQPSLIPLHRATSWLARAEAEAEDIDARFVFLWISFNAAYAQEIGREGSERERLSAFFKLLLKADQGKCLQKLLFQKFSGPIRTLVENRFVFDPFWRALREHDTSKHGRPSLPAASEPRCRRSWAVTLTRFLASCSIDSMSCATRSFMAGRHGTVRSIDPR